MANFTINEYKSLLTTYNGFGLCVRVGFGAQSFNLFLKFIISTRLNISISVRQTRDSRWALASLSYVCYNLPLRKLP